MFKRTSLLRRTFRFATLMALLACLATGVLGPTLPNLLKTWQRRAQETVEEYVDPAVRLETAVHSTVQRLPRDIAKLKSARSTCDDELGKHAEAIAELKDGIGLVGRDLRILAASARKDEGCRIRGRTLDPIQTRREAGRLLATLKRYEAELATRTKLLATAREQRNALDAAITRLERSAQEFASRVRTAQSKVEILRSGKRLQRVRERAIDSLTPDRQDTLTQVDKALDRQIQEQQERARLTNSLEDGDPYLESVREGGLLDELRTRYSMTQPAKERLEP